MKRVYWNVQEYEFSEFPPKQSENAVFSKVVLIKDHNDVLYIGYLQYSENQWYGFKLGDTMAIRKLGHLKDLPYWKEINE